MQEPSPSSSSVGAATLPSSSPRPPKRKHRPGLVRTQIACQRCRLRKNKCDGLTPACTTCAKAGTPCIIEDRLSYQQYPRNYVTEIRAQNEELQQENAALKAEVARLKETMNDHSSSMASSDPDADDLSEDASLALDIGLLSLGGATEQRYVGPSSGVHFGKVIQSALRSADYKQDHGLVHPKLRLGVEQSPEHRCPSSMQAPQTRSLPVCLPSMDTARKLEAAFFTHCWPSLPFLHRPTFIEKHYLPVMKRDGKASHASLFLVFMVFAQGAIELWRGREILEASHLDYFRTAVEVHFSALAEKDNAETIQGLLLMASFAIKEPHSLNAWMASGLAMRMAIDLGMHRKVGNKHPDLLQAEMRKRIFWSAYVLDRNIAIVLGRPLAIRDVDINVELPLQLTDQELLRDMPLAENLIARTPTTCDMSTFNHIIKLRQINSRIQDTFYGIQVSDVSPSELDRHRMEIRSDLEFWISSAPRYLSPTWELLQTTEWFQIAYSFALILLYQPSPASPRVGLDALQNCADSSISLITLYVSLYAKNKVTYTWIALHSLFMASVTMLFTLTEARIRQNTTIEVVQSNIRSSLMLFRQMGELWPNISARCRQVIERLGASTIELFDRETQDAITSASQLPNTSQQEEEDFRLEFMDWFNTVATSQPNSLPLEMLSAVATPPIERDVQNLQVDPWNVSDIQGFDDSHGLFHLGFDMAFPAMTNAFEHSSQFALDLEQNSHLQVSGELSGISYVPP